MTPLWMRPLLWFWPSGTFNGSWGNWLLADHASSDDLAPLYLIDPYQTHEPLALDTGSHWIRDCDRCHPRTALHGTRVYHDQWYPYLILHKAYLENQPNNEIMSRLYISEGTFNRTRRAAIRSLARVLSEMEAVTQPE